MRRGLQRFAKSLVTDLVCMGMIVCAVFAALLPSASAQESSSAFPSKISNLPSPVSEEAHAAFVSFAQRPPSTGACEVLGPDPGFREEMLVDVTSIGEPGGPTYQRRVALVVGNGGYKSFKHLDNPPEDATSMGRMLSALGFTVYRTIDATATSLDACVSKFSADLGRKRADVALFYYAGHGVQLTSEKDNEKINYMLAVDAKVDDAGEAFGFRQVDAAISDMRAHAEQSVFLYDACRSPPVEEGAVKQAGGEAVRQTAVVAAPVEVRETDAASQSGIFIAYATSPNKTADDAWGPEGSDHSPFTEALLDNLATPGVIIEEALANAYYEVGELTKDMNGKSQQTPWTSSSLQERLFLNGETRKSDLQIRSKQLAAQSARFRGQGLRGKAIAEALKGMSPVWVDGERATTFAEARTELFRTYQSKEVNLIGHTGAVKSVAFSPDGTRVATGGRDGTARIWDTRTGALIKKISRDESEGYVNFDSVCFNKDGSRIVTLESTGGVEQIVKILNAKTGDTLVALGTSEGHNDVVTSIALSPDETRVVTGSYDDTAKIWDVGSGALLKTLNGHRNDVTSVVFSRDGSRIVTGSEDKTAKVWDAYTGEPLKTLTDHAGAVTSVAFSPDGSRIVTGSTDKTAKVWDAHTGEPLKTVEGHSGEVGDVAFSPDGLFIITASEDRTARIWDAKKERGLIKTLNVGDGEVDNAIVSPNGAWISTVSTNYPAHSLNMWNAKTNESTFTVDGLGVAAFSPDGRRIIVGAGDNTAKIWDTHTGTLLKTLKGGHTSEVISTAFDRSGNHVVTGAAIPDGKAVIWDARSGEPLNIFDVGSGAVISVALSPDGNQIITGSSGSIAKIWDTKTGALLHSFEGNSDYFDIGRAVFSPDGNSILASSGDWVAKMWDARSYVLLKIFKGHTDDIGSAVFSKDGRRIVTASDDGTAIIWDAITGSSLKTLGGLNGERTNYADFSPDGLHVVTGSSGGTAKIWDAGLYGPELLDAAYALLTDDQREEVERERVRYWEIDGVLLQ